MPLGPEVHNPRGVRQGGVEADHEGLIGGHWGIRAARQGATLLLAQSFVEDRQLRPTYPAEPR